ncbi:MAG TPA: tetratricopeptide repeat protein [Gemmatimonadales bacterium]|nr:tetratricopeptide repeat protein [Gemmatimonadales bacterium]
MCALLLSALAPAGVAQTPAEWVAQGDKSYSDHDYAGAASAYANAVRLNPKDVQTLLKLSVSRNQIGRLPDALAAADVAIKLNPALAEAHAERAYALKRLGEQQPGATAGKERFTAAVASYKEAIRLKPAYGPAQLGLGDVYYDNLDAYADAVSAFTQALRSFPRDVELRYKLGVSYALLDRQAEAEAQLEEAVRLDGDYYEARAQLSTALRKLGRLPEALAQIRAALHVKPDYAGGHGRLALVYAAQGNRAGAVEEYHIAERLDKSELEQLGPALQKLGVTVQPSAAGARPAPRGACPTLTLEGAYDVFGGQPAEFSARVSGDNPAVKPEFNWTVSAGTIASGQGTATVSVDTNGLQGRPISAYVQLLGLAKECDVHSASRTRVLGRDLP